MTVKRDRKESSSNLKELKSVNKNLELKVSKMAKCITVLEEKVDEKNRALEVKVEESENVKKEKTDYQERLEEALSELRKERLLDKKLSLVEFKCVFVMSSLKVQWIAKIHFYSPSLYGCGGGICHVVCVSNVPSLRRPSNPVPE